MLAFTVHLVADLAHLFAPKNERSLSESEQVNQGMSAHAMSAAVSAEVSVEPLTTGRATEQLVSVEPLAIERTTEQQVSTPKSAKAITSGGADAKARQWIAAQLRRGESLTGTQVGERFGVSPATGRRWIADARSAQSA